MKVCPHCMVEVAEETEQCPHCQTWLEKPPAEKEEASRASVPVPKSHHAIRPLKYPCGSGFWNFFIVVGPLVLAVVIVLLLALLNFWKEWLSQMEPKK